MMPALRVSSHAFRSWSSHPAPYCAFRLAGRCRAFSAVAPTETASESKPSEAEPVKPQGKAKSTPLKPKEMLSYLDSYIVGQRDAKKAVANALRNRWRRQCINGPMKDEIVPKNILMVGPTGCGKTEIARRLSKLVDAPFLKVEATKFTEVGFHGRDVDQIIRDLLEVGIKRQRASMEIEMEELATAEVEQQILSSLMGSIQNDQEKETWLKHLRNGDLDDRLVSIDVATSDDGGDVGPQQPGVKVVKIVQADKQTEKKKMSVKEARKKLRQSVLDKTISHESVIQKAIESVENDGIVFIDEIDKICHKAGQYVGGDASAEGVQRDLLPIIEGSDVSTKHGNVNTNHILFICSGAFHAVKPSDLMAELQGRLPVRVALNALTEDDYFRILTEPKHNLIMQNQALLKTEGVELQIDDTVKREIAAVVWDMNSHIENIGARRLQQILEKVTEEISYHAPERAKENDGVVEIKAEDIRSSLGDMLKKTDLRRAVL
eukprot:gnl/MRDRNA2_/MRDRNA2_116548_c0_seq1.p1 gnl/MRDRNA2_/MRDRNA2_116548_c0~~gnl/MRDRNA2_/MRDRNA2_116548_c0_seq1.p1  ORF type:complete len:504 (-),score=121.65 gnl/MRDRNA2_/MRDRNA2_116548_c0_seq1:25-1500(-)